MYKIILIILLAVVSSSAMAEWVFVTQTEKDSSNFYADPDTIRKSENNVKMWILNDFSTLKLDFFISAKRKHEYDCREKQHRMLFAALYSEPMGRGTAQIYNERSDWSSASSGTIGGDLLEFACGGFYPKLPRTFPSVSSNVLAEWVEVIRSVEKGGTLYADPATIQKSGNMVTMWEMMDSKTARKGPGAGNKFIHSLVSQAEYDCKDERIRFLDFVGFSENMGKGELIESEIKPISKWMPILPKDITYKRMWKIACGK